MPEVYAKLIRLTKAVTDQAISHIIEDIDSVDHHIRGSIEQDTLWMKECFSHLINLLEVKVINLCTVEQHLADVCDKEAEACD